MKIILAAALATGLSLAGCATADYGPRPVYAEPTAYCVYNYCEGGPEGYPGYVQRNWRIDSLNARSHWKRGGREGLSRSRQRGNFNLNRGNHFPGDGAPAVNQRYSGRLPTGNHNPSDGRTITREQQRFDYELPPSSRSEGRAMRCPYHPRSRQGRRC